MQWCPALSLLAILVQTQALNKYKRSTDQWYCSFQNAWKSYWKGTDQGKKKTREGERKGNRAKKTKVNETEHYMQLEQPIRRTIIMEVRTSSVRSSNYWGHAESDNRRGFRTVTSHFPDKVLSLTSETRYDFFCNILIGVIHMRRFRIAVLHPNRLIFTAEYSLSNI